MHANASGAVDKPRLQGVYDSGFLLGAKRRRRTRARGPERMQLSSDVFPKRYRDPVRVGHGAMGDVYRAHDELLDRDVAIKLLAHRFAADPEIRARFAREGLAAARLSAE